MDVSPKLLREVEFREQWRGYNPDEVDDFLERLAVALGQLQDQLRDAVDRANRAERRVIEGSGDEGELRRTLVLAQRTADAALEEARQEAAVVSAEAEAHAADVRRAADEVAAAVVGEAEGRVASELAPLLAQRDALEGDVEALRGWAAEIRARMVDELRQQLAWLEGGESALPEPPDVLAMELPAPSEPPERSDHALDDQPGGEVLVDDAPDTRGSAFDDAGSWGEPVGDDTGGIAAHDADATGLYDALAEDDDGEGGALAAAAVDDPFLAELRRAVTDDEPLGPRERSYDEHDDEAGEGDADGEDPDDDLSSSVFRRRRRR